MPKWSTCGVPLKATDRICRSCGALTGFARPSNAEPLSVGGLAFLAALAISVGYLLIMDWMRL